MMSPILWPGTVIMALGLIQGLLTCVFMIVGKHMVEGQK